MGRRNLLRSQGSGALEITYFESVVRDRITLIQNSQSTTIAQNLDRTWIRGLESSGYTRFLLPRKVSLEAQAGLTWQEALDLGVNPAYRGKDLPNLPGREGFFSLSAARGVWGLRWEASVLGSSYRDRYNTDEKRTPPHVIQDLSCERTLSHGVWKLRGELRNIAGVRVEDIDGFPLPGRAWMAEVTWTR